MSGFHHVRRVGALRLPRRCANCKATIEAGSPAYRRTGRGHCGFYAFFFCAPCEVGPCREPEGAARTLDPKVDCSVLPGVGQ